jgi:hypothetical protein
MNYNQITENNFPPAKGKKAIPVYADKFNILVDAVNTLSEAGASNEFDTIAESTTGSGVTVDGVLLKDSEVSTDVINEKSGSGNGVTVDGVLLKDGAVNTDDIIPVGTNVEIQGVRFFSDRVDLDGRDIHTGSGSIIGDVGDSLAFFGTTPTAQLTTGVSAATFTANTSSIADDTATFGGYTIGQIVAALKAIGILA